MKVIDGGFGKQRSVKQVFEAALNSEKLEDYETAFCIMKSPDYIVVSTNMDRDELYFLLDQIKMSIITEGDYEL